MTLLSRNKLKPSDVDAVELLGGGSRVPKLQSVLSEALGGRWVTHWLAEVDVKLHSRLWRPAASSSSSACAALVLC